MNYIKITKTDIANGTGIRCVLRVSGCDVNCKGCHNPDTWNYCAGRKFDEDAMEEVLNALAPGYISGLTLSGGHPLAPNNICSTIYILKKTREKYPEKNIWLYTGYALTLENFTKRMDAITPCVEHHNAIYEALRMCDVVVDGPYIEAQKQLTLPYRGSSNQRLIDVKKTIESNEIITINMSE